MKTFAQLSAALLLTATLSGLALPATAADSTNKVVAQALSFCINTLTNQAAASAALQAGGFAVNQRSETRLSASKDSADSTIRITLRNLRKCSAEVSPRARGIDARGFTLGAIDAWAKSNNATFVLGGQGQATITANTLTFPVLLQTVPISGKVTALIEIQRQR